MKKLLNRRKTEQNEKTGPLDYTTTSTGNSASAQEQNAPLCLLHRSCKTIRLGAFLRAYCNNDLSVLIIEGNPTPEQLKDAWDEILFEWSGLIRNGDSAYMLGLNKRVALLKFDITYVENAIAILRVRFDQDIVNYLVTELGFHGIYNPEDEVAYNRQLDRVISLAKTKIVELKELEEEHERLNKTVEGKKQSEEDMMMTVSALSKYIGYRLDRDTVCADEFAAVFSLYLTESDHMKNKNQNG